MYENEGYRSAHLTILFCNTCFMIALIAESIYYGWELGVVAVLLFGLVTCWVIHFISKGTDYTRQWIYFALSMLIFFFYGIHKSNIFDLSPIMVGLILAYMSTGDHTLIRMCTVVYCLTVGYDVVFLYGNPLNLPIQMISRLVLHLIIIFVAGRTAQMLIRMRVREKIKMDERVFQLKEVNRRVESFLTNVSHELRTPINVVTGISSLMLKREANHQKRNNLTSIQLAGNRLFNQLEDILDYTEIDTGKIVASDEHYRIVSLINDVITDTKKLQMENNLELIFDVDAKIPSELIGDGKKIKKIIKHLIDNAIKFTKVGGIYVRVYALEKNYGVNLCINISDTGIGMAEDELDKITERFFQANGERNRIAGGLGLGLPIVHGLVNIMGGFIQFESVKDQGTTISVSIPQKVADNNPCMEIFNKKELTIGLFIRTEKYETAEIRDYYNSTIFHMIQKLDISVHRVFDIEELKKLVTTYPITHLILAKEEYQEDAFFIETLDPEIEVVVVANDSFQPVKNSRVKIIRKPFYALPIVNLLSARESEEANALKQERMICPGVKVLVVDDEPMNLMVAEGIFKAYQMEVKKAESGKEAIELCEKEFFDLIFLDHMMPEMDGVQTLKVIRRKQLDFEEESIFIAFTANAVSGAREMFFQEGFDEFISKPIEDRELRRLLRKVLPTSAIEYIKINDSDETLDAIKMQQAMQESIDMQNSIKGNNYALEKLLQLKKADFNVESGLGYCGNDRDYYLELLLQFAESTEQKIVDMNTFFKEEDIKNYQIMVHSLKSTSKLVGVDRLSKMAMKLEEAAKNQDITYIKNNHEVLIKRYQEAKQCILDVLVPNELDLADGEIINYTEISQNEFLVHLSNLKQSLDTFEAMIAENLLEKMKDMKYQGELVSKMLDDVKRDIDNFELATASDKVESLIISVKGGVS